MIAPDPPPFPSGYVSIWEAIERVGRASVAGWTGKEREADEAFHALAARSWIRHRKRMARRIRGGGAVAQAFREGRAAHAFKPPAVPSQLAEPLRRYEAAFGIVCALYGHGTVHSAALLLENFTRHEIPARNWLDRQAAVLMLRTGKATVGMLGVAVLGWVMIDRRTLDDALADHTADRTGVAPAPASAGTAIRARPKPKRARVAKRTKPRRGDGAKRPRRAAKATPPKRAAEAVHPKRDPLVAYITEHYPPGRPRPSWKTIAEERGVSMSTVARAFSVLRGK
jgi:hypothetical protein